MAAEQDLPKTMKALVLRSFDQPPTIEEVATPQAVVGSAITRVLAANVLSYSREVYNGQRQYPMPLPIIPGMSFIGRVATVGPDATKVKPGDLVLVDPLIRSRDSPAEAFLAGLHQGGTEGSRKLMSDVWRDFAYAEYCKAPLECLTVLDEARLMRVREEGGLGYSLGQLAYITRHMVPYGGLRDIELRAGQTVIVAPATGPFGSAAVGVALAMGARVIAFGRNEDALKLLRSRVPTPDRVETVKITGDMMADCKALRQYGTIEAFYDIGPPEAFASTHIKSAILALSHGARISIMGGYKEDIAIPHNFVMHNNIRIYGKWMYEREDIADMMKLVGSGLLDLSGAEVDEYLLEQFKEAFDNAAEKNRMGQVTIMKP